MLQPSSIRTLAVTKGCPVVDFGELFAGFVEVALGYEHGHNLLVVVHEEHKENKDDPELVLQALD